LKLPERFAKLGLGELNAGGTNLLGERRIAIKHFGKRVGVEKFAEIFRHRSLIGVGTPSFARNTDREPRRLDACSGAFRNLLQLTFERIGFSRAFLLRQ
jgi:hypothetical protein